MFAWMRPNDLIWNYWVNNYLLGNAPPAFDMLYWKNDTTRLPARLHADFLDLIGSNPYINAGRLKVRDTPLDMRQVNMDSYVVAGVTDHITPWQGCYHTARLYGGRSTFVSPTAAISRASSIRPAIPRPCSLPARRAPRTRRCGSSRRPSTPAAGGRTGSTGSRRTRAR